MYGDSMNRLNVHRLAVVAAGALIAFTCAAQAQVPTKTVRLVVPFPPGGTVDALARIMAEKIRGQFPGGVIVDNRPGAGGNIGAADVFNADPDGTTLLVSPPPPISINAFLYKKMSFDPRQFTPITVLATVPNVVVVNPNKLPAKNVPELISMLKANPDKYSFASQGNGTTSHLTAALFAGLSNTQMVHIPYKGTGPAIADLLGGQVDLFFDNLSSSIKYHQAGKLRILAVADDQRSAVLPDVPTFRESGLPAMKNMTAEVWYAVVAPPKTPPAVAEVFQKAFAAALAQPEIKKKLADLGVDAQGWPRDKTGAFFKEEMDKWGKVVKDNNVVLD
jgi:tripartite-type tricarboxylate transporter receptor subunit TctC